MPNTRFDPLPIWPWLLTALLTIGLPVISPPQIAAQEPSADAPQLPPATTAPVDFVRDIQPIFQANCYGCHGPKKQEGSFRLDHKPTALRGGESGVVIEPGKSADSLLVELVAGVVTDRRMPPEGQPLTAEQVAKIRGWIDQGAVWPDEASVQLKDPRSHWAFQPPQRPATPTVTQPEGLRNEIDHFVRAKLEQAGLSGSPAADPVTLVRRLYLDLIGLPPTPAQVDAFLADTSDAAYDRLVDQLLDSPHYGERWGRIWLDAARYADSDGFEKDKLRQVWAYRQWVIESLNRDLPYDQFIIDQIAGDLLPNPTQDQIVATGFLRNSMINEEGGVDPEQFRMEAMFDRMDAIGKSILGMTIQCAQCHNHKYDPLTQADYYRMFAFLNSCHEANVAVYTADEQRQRADLMRQIGEIEAELQHRTPDWAARLESWVESVKNDQPQWEVVRPVDDVSGGQKHYVLEDNSVLAAGYAPTQHTTEFVAQTDQQQVRAVRLELLCDPNLPLSGPGRSIHGQCALTEFQLLAGPADGSQEMKEVKLAAATADVNPAEQELDKLFDDRSNRRRVTGPIEYALDRKDETAWGIDAGPGRSNVPRKAVFVLESPVSFPGGTKLKFQLVQNHGGWNSDDNQNNNLGRFRFAVTGSEQAKADPAPAAVRAVMNVPASERTPRQTAALFSYWRTTVPEWSDANARIEALWKQHPAGSSQLVLAQREELRPTSVLKRGDFLKPIQEVDAGVPGFLHPLPEGATPDRLAFARWLVDRRSPTAARSLVNRIWQAYFGIGLVASSEDLGTQSEPPSHPELLDWLAVELMDHGWSVKHLHRQIVRSATYRQTSNVTPEALQADPLNRLLGRAPRLRVEAEIVRDIALSASGLLNPTVGGPSVFPPLPEFMLLPPVSYGPKVWTEDHGPNRYRRSIYTFRYRSIPYPALQNFDAPNGDFSCVRRTRSNTPLQALTTLNEPVFVECARALALETLRSVSSSDGDRMSHAFRRCVARQPTQEELAELLKLLNDQQRYLGEGWTNAWELAAGKVDQRVELPEGCTPVQLAAWTSVARVLLNLDETISKP